MINPWKVLGVNRKSTEAEIRDAFYDQARKYHPDMPKADPVKFSRANRAYQMLKDKIGRSVAVDHLKNECATCPKCSGAGVQSKSKGMTTKIYTTCSPCGGSGFIIEEGDEDVVIELRGTAGIGGKGRHKKR